MKTREEHLEWCKQNAREYLSRGDIANAITSMMSDLKKHPETDYHSPYMTLLGGLYAANYNMEDAKRFIEGFR